MFNNNAYNTTNYFINSNLLFHCNSSENEICNENPPEYSEEKTKSCTLSFQLPNDITKNLNLIANELNTTTYILCQSTWAILLSRYTENGSVTFNIQSAAHNNYNLHPVQVELDPEKNITSCIKDLIQQNKRTHESFIAMQTNTMGNTAILCKKKLTTQEIVDLKNNGVNYILNIRTSGSHLQGFLCHAGDNTNSSILRQIARNFLSLLKSLSSNRNAKIASISMLSEMEHQKIFGDWNNTQSNYPTDKTLHQVFEEQVLKTPNNIAVSFQDQNLTYSELNEKANQIANYLTKRNIKAESLVGVVIERCLEMLPWLLGILKAGAAYIPIRPNYPLLRIDYMLDNSSPEIIITQKKYMGVANKLKNLNPSREFIFIDNDNKLKNEAKNNLKETTKAKNLISVLYTSGTTGEPKGVENLHAGIMNRLWWMQKHYKISQNDRFLQKTSITFDVSMWELFLPLITGARVCISNPGDNRSANEIIKKIQQYQINIIHFAPSMLQSFLETDGVEQCTSLTRVFSSGEALTPNLVDTFFSKFNCELHNLYGPTEASIDVTAWSCDASHSGIIPIGSPIDNMQIYILDKNLNPTPINVSGEIFIGGMGLARGYINSPGLTFAKFISNPFGQGRLYRTGDLARWMPDGNIEFIGRIDEQIKLRGIRIEPGDIENIFLKYHNIKNVVVLTKKDSHGYQELIAYLVKKSNKALHYESLSNHLKKYLPCYMIPNSFIEVSSLPVSPHGKIDKKQLLETAGNEIVSNKKNKLPSTKVQSILREIISKAINKNQERIGIDDKLVDLGVHSLLLAKLANEIHKIFHYKIDPLKIITTKTIEKLSHIITENTEAI